jgi:hypothetical protein
MSRNRAPRSWWREDHFIDHPGFLTKSADAFVGSGAGKTPKVYCKECFPFDVHQVIQGDIRSIAEGRITTARTEVNITAYCELMDQFNTGSVLIIVTCSMEQAAVESWTRRIHSLRLFDMPQPSQIMPEPDVSRTTTCACQGRVSKKGATLAIRASTASGHTGLWDVSVGFWVTSDAPAIAPPFNSFRYTRS